MQKCGKATTYYEELKMGPKRPNRKDEIGIEKLREKGLVGSRIRLVPDQDAGL